MQHYLLAQSGGEVAGTAFVGLFMLLVVVFQLFVGGFLIASLVFWIISLVHVLSNEDVKDRVLWIVVILVAGGLGGIIYFFVVKRHYDKGGMREPNHKPNGTTPS